VCLGCGLMGAGIAQTAQSAGFETTVRKFRRSCCRKVSRHESLWSDSPRKERITAEQQKQTRDRLSGTTSFTTWPIATSSLKQSSRS